MNQQVAFGIGRLERLPLRQVWNHEAYDFTKWLQDNIDILNETLDLTLVNVDREKSAGSFSVDLVAEDEGGGKVIIENQLEKSNHDHLGKLITYYTALDARAAVWIVSDPRPEHVAAVAWLNDSSSGRFYIVKVEAIRIGQSPPAPLLTLIVGPSAETEEVARAKKQFADRYDIRHRWWSQLVVRLDAKMHAHITPGSYSWIGTSSGVRGLNFNYTVTQDECGAELYIDRGNGTELENKLIFDQLFEKRDQIDPLLAESVSWQRLDGKRASRIKMSLPGGYRSQEDDWEAIQTPLVAAMNRLETALRPHLKSLKLGQ
ncbi:DUF4268 domain-containing protein [Sinorhizobium fredii]|uniref:DUF4268 domain-containing protein n=1 Tax=Rhizobium fredii TaxID=380 RepID=UPI0005956C37|nr:DUF4268 domain-containing protein [Sinorhizobium fredii]WOS65833.1 DUF4268 domain-containing protein [Sinorhizobium fredii GR64]